MSHQTIRGFMGPPLETSFASCLPANQIETAIQLYRSYYKEKGVETSRFASNSEWAGFQTFFTLRI